MPDDGKSGGGTGFGGGEPGVGGGIGGEVGVAGSTPQGPNVALLDDEPANSEQGATRDCMKRAKAAEARAAQLETQLAEARAALDSVERRHRIDMALIDADAIDLESARLLTELAVTSMPDADVAIAVSDLKRRKPFLFRESSSLTLGAAMGAAIDPVSPVQSARDQARTGDRRALLSYLRARRAG